MPDSHDRDMPADRLLVLATAPRHIRPALATAFRIDDRLAEIVRRTREAMVGQMRLTWWHDALSKLDSEPAPAEPLLREAQAHVLPLGVRGSELAAMVDGWEELIVADTLDDAALSRHAEARGAMLFALAGRMLGGDSPLLAAAGRAWALSDLAGHLSIEDAARRASAMADDQFLQAFSTSWPRALRPIGMLSLIARLDRQQDSPMTKALHTARFRLIGR